MFTTTPVDVQNATVITWTDIDGDTTTSAFLIDGADLLIGDVLSDGTVTTDPMSWGPIEQDDWYDSPVYGRQIDAFREVTAANPGAAVTFPHPVGHAAVRAFIDSNPYDELDLSKF